MPQHLVCISWYLSWFLATNDPFWLVPAFFVILNDLHSQNYDFSVKSIPWVSCYSECIFVLPCKLFHLVSRLDHFLSSILILLHILWYYSFIFLLINWNLLMTCIFSTSLFQLSFFLSKALLLAFGHLYCPLMCPPDLFLIEYLPLCSSFQIYIVM